MRPVRFELYAAWVYEGYRNREVAFNNFDDVHCFVTHPFFALPIARKQLTESFQLPCHFDTACNKSHLLLTAPKSRCFSTIYHTTRHLPLLQIIIPPPTEPLHHSLKEHNTHTRCALLSFNAVRWAWLQQIASTWRLASYLTSPWEAGIVRPITGMESKSVRIPCNKNLPIASRCAAYYGCSTFISKWNAFVALRSHTLYTCRVLYVPAGCSVC